MVKLAVIADDFTGALDTGIQFGESGIKTKVFTGPDFQFGEIADDVAVMVVNAKTRHQSPKDAYDTVYHLAQYCLGNGVEYLYKKTDSALRGCPGSELKAVMDASDHCVHFIAAYPEMNRTTVNGTHYINGTPVSESAFGHDPFEPIMESYIPQLLKSSCDVTAIPVKRGEPAPFASKPAVLVYDAETTTDIRKIVGRLREYRQLKLTAGCAGFAACLAEILDVPRKAVMRPWIKGGFLVICGSLNAITENQIKFARKKGFERITLTKSQKSGNEFWNTGDGNSLLSKMRVCCNNSVPLIVDVFSDYDLTSSSKEQRIAMSGKVADRLAEIGEKWLGFEDRGIIVLTGGDTAYAFIKRLGCMEIEPVCEIAPGAVLFSASRKGHTIHIVSKSGGFGSESVLVDIYEKLRPNRD